MDDPDLSQNPTPVVPLMNIPSPSPGSTSVSSVYPSVRAKARMHQALVILRKLAFFLDYSYPHPDIQQHRYVGSLEKFKDKDLKMMKHVAQDLDGFLPFPRRAPSVLHAMSASGLIDRPFDKSLLFSAVSFRAVFFKSPYHFDHSTFLRDYEEYRSRVANRPDHPSAVITPAVHTDTYWANPNSYSGGPHSPDVRLIRSYWESVSDKRFFPPHKAFKSKPSLPPCPLPFGLFMKEYLLFNRKIDRQGEKINLFPLMGPLIGYLCALDLAYAGHVAKPSLDDVVNAMLAINAGGIRGLIALGLVDKKEGKKSKYGLDEIKLAFSTFHAFLDTHLDADEKKKMAFDSPMSEHFCCKISKLFGIGLIELSDDVNYISCSCCI